MSFDDARIRMVGNDAGQYPFVDTYPLMVAVTNDPDGPELAALWQTICESARQYGEVIERRRPRTQERSSMRSRRRRCRRCNRVHHIGRSCASGKTHAPLRISGRGR